VRRALPLLALALALAGAAPAGAASRVWPTPVRYSAALHWDQTARTLSGTERIAFVNRGPKKLSSVYLRVWPNGYGSCGQRWARVSILEGGHATGWTVACTALRVRLAHPVAAGKSGAVRLKLHVKVQPRANRFGQDDGVVYLGNALPLLAVDDSSGPALEPYTDLGDPFYSLTSRWSVRLDVPRGLTAATTGASHGTHRVAHGMKRLTIVASHARDFAIVLGKLSVDSTRTASGVLLRRYSQPGADRAAAKRTLDVAAEAVDTYSSWFGSPRLGEIDLLPGPGGLGAFGSGMEYPGLVLTPNTPQTVAHELAHEWWYSLVGDDQWRSPWLDEAFAEFSSRRLPASVVGDDDLDCDGSDPVTSAGGKGPLSASMSHWDAAGAEEYYRSVYLGGTCALRLLEKGIGAGAMTAFLHGFVDAHRFGVVTTSDFVSALRAAAPPGFDVDGWLARSRIAAP
jgi:hypothetical protein